MNPILTSLIQTKSIEIKSEPPFFIWSSGKTSPIYCDNRRLLSHPTSRKNIVTAFTQKLKDIPTDAICGVATAGISWGALIAHELNLPFIYVRSKAKEHGKKNAIEGDLIGINNVIVVEDLISTGRSSLLACETLIQQGISPKLVTAIFSYNLTEAKQNFQKANIPFESLANIDDLVTSNVLNEGQKKNLQEFLC